jgi:bile acid:Na+ symporter, BASS family
MQGNAVLSVLIPMALVIIMLGLGLSLKLQDFTQILARPRSLLIALGCHLLLLPLVCFVLVYLFELPPAIGVGMMLLSASPGGTSASLYTHLARGAVALSITLAGVTSLLALVTLPVIGNFSFRFFYGEAAAVRVEFVQVAQIFAVAIVPALIGAAIRSRFPTLSLRLERPVRLLATLFLVALVFFALVSQWNVLVAWGPAIGLVVLAFNVVCLGAGYVVPLWLGVERREAIAVSMSVGIRNAVLVIAMALSHYMLNDPELAIAPAIYGILAYFTSALFVWILNRRLAAAA